MIEHLNENTQLTDRVLNIFSEQIEFIDNYADRPVQRFEEFRRSRVFLTGSGAPFQALVVSLARNGLENIVVDEEVQGLELNEELAEIVNEYRVLGIPFQIERLSLENALSKQGGQFAAVCYAGDESNLDDLLKVNAHCCKESTYFIPGILLLERAFVGPLVSKNSSGCFLCFLMRMSDNSNSHSWALIWKSIALKVPWRSDKQSVSSPVLRILGNMVGFELFKLLTGHLASETKGAALSFHLETLEPSASRILPHPCCTHCSTTCFETDLQLLSRSKEESTAPSFALKDKLNLTRDLIDRHTGIATGFDDDDLVQAPLFLSKLKVSAKGTSGTAHIPGHSILSNADARLDATLLAVKTYAAGMADPRRMWNGTIEDAYAASLVPVPHSFLSGWTGAISDTQRTARTYWIRAASLRDGTHRVIPAAAVFCSSPFNTGSFEKVDAGIGIGFTFREACNDAVSSLHSHEVLKSIAMHEVELFEIDVESLSRERDVRYILRSVRDLQRDVRLFAYIRRNAHCVALGFSPGDTTASREIVVGDGESLSSAVVSALIEFLAITIGHGSCRTVADHLPSHLGYVLEPSRFRHRPYHGEESMGSLTTKSIVWNDLSDILVSNMTTSDLAAVGLFVVKAKFVRSRDRHSSGATEV